MRAEILGRAVKTSRFHTAGLMPAYKLIMLMFPVSQSRNIGMFIER